MARPAESPRGRRGRARRIARLLRELYPAATSALDYGTPFELLVATVLSAQCTDSMVNRVTPALFRRYPTPRDLASADRGELEALVRSTGFFRAKARALVGLARALEERHGGEVPADLERLVELPGVGRKTANVVLGTWFGVPAAVVDTHVKRLAGRLALSAATRPVAIERDLMSILPEREWTFVTHALVWHGRRVCTARRPRCAACALRDDCPSADPSVASRAAVQEVRRREQRRLSDEVRGGPTARKPSR